MIRYVFKRKAIIVAVFVVTIFSAMTLGLGQVAQAKLIFEDGFEAGNFNKWPSTTVEGSGGTQEVVTSPVRYGTHSAHFKAVRKFSY